MNLFAIDLAGGTMSKAPKKKAAPRRRTRTRYVTLGGERVRRSARGDRLLRAVRVLKGLEVPPR